jgi:hypothetical protein
VPDLNCSADGTFKTFLIMLYFQLLSNKEQVFNHDLPPGEADSREAASLTEPMAKSKASIRLQFTVTLKYFTL